MPDDEAKDSFLGGIKDSSGVIVNSLAIALAPAVVVQRAVV